MQTDTFTKEYVKKQHGLAHFLHECQQILLQNTRVEAKSKKIMSSMWCFNKITEADIFRA